MKDDKELLLKELKKLQKEYDIESGHAEADNLLLEYIGDSDIEEAYNAIQKWYA